MKILDKDIDNLLFIDIETVSGYKGYNDMPENLKQYWDKKASYQKDFDGSNEKELYVERAGIFSEFGKIIVVSIGQLFYDKERKLCLKVKSIANHDEKALLFEFKSILSKYKDNLNLCGHNIKEFDLPYIGRRMLVNGINVPAQLNISGKKPWEINHIDTMELWKFGDRKNFTSLDLLATILEIPSSKTDMNGSQVGDYYYNKDGLSEISEYCNKDVITTAYLFLRLKFPDIELDISVIE